MNQKKVIVRPEAEADITDAYQWYETQRKGLGESFLLCVEEALARASRDPTIYPIIYQKARRLLIHRFPFGLFFLADEKGIVVLAVLHARRHPKTWKERR